MPHQKPPRKPSGAPATTRRAETPSLEGREPLPEELTGRASGTTEDLEALFDDNTEAHLTDGFRGGSDDDHEADVKRSDTPEADSGTGPDEPFEAESEDASP